MNTLKNVFYLYHLAWQYNKKYLFYLLLHFLVTAIDPFVVVIFPKLILDEILGNRPFLNVILLVLCITGLFLVTRNGMVAAKQKGELEGEYLMIRLRLLVNKANMTTAFKNIEDPAYLDMRDQACQIIWNSTYFNTFAFSFANLSSGFLQMAGIIAIISMLNWMIIFILLLLFALNMGYQIIMQKKNYILDKETARIRRRWEYLDEVVTDFKYGKMIRLESLSDWLLGKSRENRDEFYNKQKSMIQNNTKVTILGSLIAGIQEFGIYAYLIYKIIYEEMMIGNFYMYLSAVNQFSVSLSSILSSIIQLNKYSLYMMDFRKFLQLNSEYMKEESEHNLKPDVTDKYTIEFDHVFFRYPRTEKWILKDINLVIGSCEKITLVGDNGAGKTTLIKLLMRLYPPTKGKILLNGTDICEYDYSSYQKMVAAVFQDYKIFAFTIGENILMGEKNKSNGKRLEKVIEQSGLKEKVETLTNKMDTYMGRKFEEQGMELSGGEQQKLSVARALFQDAPILILDEPTANLSPIAEHDIYKHYYQMAENKITVFVSHRLSSSRFCDKVVLLENGIITEYGSHEALMQQGGTYAEMFRLQAQYYNDLEEGNLL